MKAQSTLLFLFLVILINVQLKAQAPDWNTQGNAGTDPTTDYVGTQDTKGLNFATDFTNQGLFMMRLTTTGRLGLGTLTPNTLLHLHQATANTDVNFQMTNNATGSGATDVK